MELYRRGEPFLRLTSTPLISYLAPSTSSSRRFSILRSRRLLGKQWVFHRKDIHRRKLGAAAIYRFQSTGSATQLKESDEIVEDPLAGLFDDGRPRQRGEQRQQKHENSNGLNNPSRSQISPPSSHSLGASSRQTPQGRSNINAGSNGGQMGSLFPPKPSNPPSQTRSSGIAPGSIASSMQMPPTPSTLYSNLSAPLSSMFPISTTMAARRSKRTLRSRPQLGRTVEVEPKIGHDMGGALRKLGMILARDKFRRVQFQQKFHERPGLKKKRLKRVRWRTFFKKGFRAAVERVQMMRKQGW